MEINNEKKVLEYLAQSTPDAVARVRGNSEYKNIRGTVTFYQMSWGVYVISSVSGLPFEDGKCGSSVLALHIHNGNACTGNDKDAFANAGTHYNPNDCPHPYHAGDLPPLFVNDGYAWSAVLTQRFSVEDVIGLPVIIHRGMDDFTTQPSGNAGQKIACGIISKIQ